MASYISVDTSDPSEKEEGLLEGECYKDDNVQECHPLHRGSRSWFRNHLLAISFHTLLLAANLFLCLAYTRWTSARCSHGPQHQYSAPRDIIEYEPRRFDLSAIHMANGTLNPDKPTNFNGDPRPELDEAWSNLTRYQNIRVQKEELGQFANDDTIISLADGSGYFTTMAVFHALHCVKRLHHFIYRDVYHKGLSKEDGMRLEHHTEHCLDWLRQYVQCNADTTFIALHWTNGVRTPIALDSGKHQCVKWDRLDHWMEEHSFDAFEPGLLVHPKLGPVYGEGSQGDKIGFVTLDGVLHGSRK